MQCLVLLPCFQNSLDITVIVGEQTVRGQWSGAELRSAGHWDTTHCTAWILLTTDTTDWVLQCTALTRQYLYTDIAHHTTVIIMMFSRTPVSHNSIIYCYYIHAISPVSWMKTKKAELWQIKGKSLLLLCLLSTLNYWYLQSWQLT